MFRHKRSDRYILNFLSATFFIVQVTVNNLTFVNHDSRNLASNRFKYFVFLIKSTTIRQRYFYP